jgi:hypothetical protein
MIVIKKHILHFEMHVDLKNVPEFKNVQASENVYKLEECS